MATKKQEPKQKTDKGYEIPVPKRDDSPPEKPVFHENWFPAKKAAATLAATELAPPEGDCIEVGCWEGRSTVLLANALYPRTLHVIDHFEGDLTDPGSMVTTKAQERDVRAIFISNMESLTRGNYVLHVMGWREFFETYTGRIGFIHIDGEHTYREARDNIRAAAAHLVPGGVMCGDDYSTRAVRRAVRKTLGDVPHTDATWWWQAPPRGRFFSFVEKVAGRVGRKRSDGKDRRPPERSG